MPSLTARLIASLFRMTGSLRKRYSDGPDFLKHIEQSRAEQQFPSAKLRKRVDIRESSFEGRKIFRFAPKDRPVAGHLLYWHGGGYVYPAVDIHWQFLAHMAEKHGIVTTAPLYPLAPEASAEEAVDWAMKFYREFTPDRAGPFVMGGDSAGGGLCAAVVPAARDEGRFLPKGLILICPWLDISVSHPDQPAIEPRDCVLTIGGTHAAAKLYTRDLSFSDPKVSPLFGNWDGLPPMLMFGGGDDILVPDARALKAKLPSIDYVEEVGMMHDWPIFFLRESRAAQARMAEFIGQNIA
ncbi:alpha/beta hydrolase [uncultured Sphingorhabdus sp.]|uniref:alpha/beta hydrolase fold domain-containing protein n=1 Tax=uncultured Sphingorhabdus sp. TaxID=1686106 RepID=UPI00261889DC|nr:alpha/beta hydrolase [uncultured Sphingorhabdus sp.]